MSSAGPKALTMDQLLKQLEELQILSVPGQMKRTDWNQVSFEFIYELAYEDHSLEGNSYINVHFQVQNNAGGYVYEVSDEIRIRRFLILGTSGGTYYVSEKELTFQNVSSMVDIIKRGKGAQLLKEVVEVSTAGRAPKQDSTLMCLALCAKASAFSPPDIFDGGFADKKLYQQYIQKLQEAAYKNLSAVCRIPTHLFDFVKYCEIICQENKKSTGWGRSMRRAISKWYTDKKLDALAMHITKYQQRNGWSHRDLLRLSHAKPKLENKEDSLLMDHIFHYAVHGNLEMKKNEENYEPASKKKRGYDFDQEAVSKIADHKVINFLQGFTELKQLKTEDQVKKACELIEKHRFVREHVSSELLNYPDIWKELLKDMPMTALLRNLSKLSALDIISGKDEKNSEWAKKVVEKFNDENAIKQAKLHPLTILTGASTYNSGRGLKGKLTWEVNPDISKALNSAFYKAFRNVEPTGKRVCLAFDVSGSMCCPISGSSITCRTASAALGLVTLRTEPVVECMAFQDKFVPLNINKDMTLEEIERTMDNLPFGSTNCAAPMEWALAEKKKFDIFIVYTDSETYFGDVHPHQALKNYRKAMDIPNAKLIVMGMVATEFTIADPEDKNMLDIVGFDTAVPELIRSFILEEI